MVVGASALIGCALEANGSLHDAPDTAQDFEMGLTGADASEGRPTLGKMLNDADVTNSVNTERLYRHATPRPVRWGYFWLQAAYSPPCERLRLLSSNLGKKASTNLGAIQSGTNTHPAIP